MEFPVFLFFLIIFVVEHKKSRTTNVQTKMGITLILYCWWSDVISEGQMFVQKIKCKLCTTDAHKQKITTHAKQNKNINIKYKQTDTDDTELAVNFGSQHFVAVLCNVHYGIRAFFVVVFLCACHALHCCELTVQTISWTGFIDHPTAASRQWLRLHMH